MKNVCWWTYFRLVFLNEINTTAHSTETALLAVKESLQTAQAASVSSVLILLDLSAAFDRVNHSILLSSLAATGICGTAPDWIKSYLSGRSSQFTKAGNVSASHPLVTGVPQGLVPSSSLCTLGPLVPSFLLMACHTIVMLMIPNSFSPFPHLIHRSLSEQQRRWPPSNADWKFTSSGCISPSLPHPHN